MLKNLIFNLLLGLIFLSMLLNFSGCTNPTGPLLNYLNLSPNESQMKDTFVSNLFPNDNTDSIPHLEAGTLFADSVIHRTYLQFDLNMIPNNAVISEAKVGLYFTEPISYVSIPIYIDVPIAVYRVDGYWNESTLNWYNQPDVYYKYEDVQLLGEETDDYVWWDITNLVQKWVSGTMPNYGICLADQDEATFDDIKKFYSSGHTNSSQWPRINISYYLP